MSVRSLNELTMKHFTDGEKVATKAGTKKEVRSFSIDKDSRQSFSIYDVDYRTKFVQATFKYRGTRRITNFVAAKYRSSL